MAIESVLCVNKPRNLCQANKSNGPSLKLCVIVVIEYKHFDKVLNLTECNE